MAAARAGDARLRLGARDAAHRAGGIRFGIVIDIEAAAIAVYALFAGWAICRELDRGKSCARYSASVQIIPFVLWSLTVLALVVTCRPLATWLPDLWAVPRRAVRFSV